ncbi:restriction endonuclease subunit S [Vagococcus lutrae]|uniref:restriction endonuclease subunit S n=1 Tax=Vagococcus lutrae TaxID=81947 RepID=UPI00288E4FBD|nr:restriction endonuclease subunit S [Vagococcus lutrae]MDT2802350.1 restriction endonuclease subunit S [Vagococcus lutrae]
MKTINKQPKIRFKGYTDEWQQRKLGELAESFEYGLNAPSKEYDGENKYLRITDIDESSRQFKTESLTSPNIDLELADNYILKKGDILFARTGASVGKTYRYNERDGVVYYAGFLIRARIKTDVNAEFIFQNTLTENYNNYIKVTSQRSGQPGVNAFEYSKFELMMPKQKEQQKIGNFFKQLDDTIALHQRQLEVLKNMKTSFLQKMYI